MRRVGDSSIPENQVRVLAAAPYMGEPGIVKTGREGEGYLVFDYHSFKWRKKSEKIKRRDGYQCQWCKRYGKNIPAVVVHHIKEADEYPELAYTDSNLVSLCRACHNKAHPDKVRATRGRK